VELPRIDDRCTIEYRAVDSGSIPGLAVRALFAILVTVVQVAGPWL
jgi:hypothetical protein